MPPADDDIETGPAVVERDVAEIRAHTQALNALRETQLEHGRKLDEHSRQFAEHVRETREGFSTLATGMAQITTLLTNRGSEGLE